MGNDDQVVFMPMPGGGGVPIPPKNDRADLIDKINPNALVEVIRHKLLGEEYVNGKWVLIESLRDMALTERGAWEISNVMLSVSSINVSISKLKDHEIKRRLMSITRTVQVMLVSNWKEYGIHNTSQFRYVHEIIFTNSLVVLKQADEASIQELLKGTVNENRNVNTEVKQSGTSRLKRALGMG